MESIRDLRIRIKSIQNTRQITESMRLIATRKVLKTRKRMDDNRPYLKQYRQVADAILANPNFSESEYIAARPSENTLVILITGDRGLCAGYNVNAAKHGRTLGRQLPNTRYITIGKKGNDFLRRRRKPIIKTFRGLSENPFYEDAQDIAAQAVALYDAKEVDQVFVSYTKYHSMLNLEPAHFKILPLERTEESPVDFLTRYDTDGAVFVKKAVAAYVTAVLFAAMLESAVCEQSARVMGMDSASKNCDKIVETLTLRYNQMRQGAITQEIAEIVGGAQSTGT
jgi:F-type H+-transporting ATPase subunit gamma